MIVNVNTGRTVAYRPHTALSFRQRLFGLMGKRFETQAYDAMIFAGCRSLHTAFMRMPIDIVFLTRDSTVTGLRRAVKPWRVVCGPRHAYWALELPAGVIDATATACGHRLNMNMEIADPAPAHPMMAASAILTPLSAAEEAVEQLQKLR